LGKERVFNFYEDLINIMNRLRFYGYFASIVALIGAKATAFFRQKFEKLKHLSTIWFLNNASKFALKSEC